MCRSYGAWVGAVDPFYKGSRPSGAQSLQKRFALHIILIEIQIFKPEPHVKKTKNMKVATHIIAALLSSAPLTLFSQATQPEPQPYIEVTGTAEKEVVPDEIYIAITLKEKYANKVKVTIEDQETKLKESLQKIGIGPGQLYLSDADASYVKVNWKTKDVLTQKDYTLKVSDAPAVGKVFQELEKLDIKDAGIAKVNHSKMDELRKEVRIMAIQAAKEKAVYLLAAIGQQAGKPLVITEINTEGYYGNVNMLYSSNERLYDQAPQNKQQSGEIQFEKILVRSGISARFSIQ